MVFESLKRLKKSEFFKGSIILLALINVGNVLNYLYQIIMARMLGPGDYGILAVLISLTYIFAIPTIAIQTGLAKKISRLNSKKEYGKMKGLFYYFLKRLFFVSIIIFMLFVVLAIFISEPLGIALWLLVLTGLLIVASFIYPIAAGSLQGLKKFSELGWNTILIFGFKLILAILLVFFGFRVYGAVLGFVLSIFIGFIFAIPYLKEIFKSKKEVVKESLFSKENILIFSSMLVFVLMYSIDVILAKIFFSPEITGQYAVISVLGKIILFSTMSVGNAMFPITSEKHQSGAGTQGVFKKALWAVSIICIISIILLSGFANQILNLLFGEAYVALSGLMFPMTITFSFIALFNIIILYRISKDEFTPFHLFLTFLFLGIQVVLLSIFSKSIEQFTLSFMFSSIITFIGGLLLIRKWKK